MTKNRKTKVLDMSVETIDMAVSLINDCKLVYGDVRYEISNFEVFGVEFVNIKVYKY